MPFCIRNNRSTPKASVSGKFKTISQECNCTCINITEYKALSFNTDAVRGCLFCDKASLLHDGADIQLRKLKQSRNTGSISAVSAGIGSTAAFIATAGLSELFSGGLGITTTVYKSTRVAHLLWAARKLKRFRDSVLWNREHVRVEGCLCDPGDEDDFAGGEVGKREVVPGLCELSIM